MGNARRVGRKSRAKALTRATGVGHLRTVTGEALSEAFHCLSEAQWKYRVGVMADGKEAAQGLAERWALAMTRVADTVLKPAAVSA
jgi:hypothetical protein